MQFKSYEHFQQLTITGLTDARQSLIHKKGCYPSQWLNNVHMYTFAKYDQNTPCGFKSREHFH